MDNDLDGVSEVWAVFWNTQTDATSFQLNKDGSWTEETTDTVDGVFRSFGDADGDGRLDLLVSEGDAFTLWLAQPDGGFAGPSVAVGSLEGYRLFADVTGDGYADIVDSWLTSTEDANTLFFHAGNGDGSFSAADEVELAFPGGASQRVAGDPAVVVVLDWVEDDAFDPNAHVLQFTASSRGGLELQRSTDEVRPYWFEATDDFDRDGDVDVLVRDKDTQELIRLDAEGDGFVAEVLMDVDGVQTVAEDFDLDEHIDLYTDGPGGAAVRLGSAEGFGPPQEVMGPEAFTSAFSSGDISGDGYVEFYGLLDDEWTVWSLAPCEE